MIYPGSNDSGSHREWFKYNPIQTCLFYRKITHANIKGRKNISMDMQRPGFLGG